MLPISNPSLLAVNIEDVVPIVILIVSFLSWIFSAMKNNKEGPKNKKAAPKKRPQNFEDEMEQFLQQVNDPKAQERLERKKRRAAREKKRQQQQWEAGLEIEIIEEPTRPNRRQKSRSSKTKPQPVPQAKASRVKESISSRTLGTRDLGTVSKHVDEYLDKGNEAKEARLKSLGQGVVQSVSSHMGDAEFYGTTAEATNSEARKIRQMLTGKESIRRAIVLNEVFSKPLSLRKD